MEVMCANLNRLVTVQLVVASPILCGFSRCGSFEPRGRRMTVMRRYSNYTMCFLAFLLLIIGARCSDPDKAGNPGPTPPTVISVAPPDGSAGVCPNTIMTATFRKAMNPATINDTTFLGNAEPTEKRKNLAAERAVNLKAYLTGGESKLGIDPSRIEVDPQHIFPPAGKVAVHHGGLVRDGSPRGHLHPKTMFPRRHLHGMEFMALDTVENDQMFRVGSL